MLSVCIPVYNYFIQDFVNEIVKQCNELNINFELIIFDDNSDTKFASENCKLKSESNIIYHYNQKNAGRSAARNSLAKLAQYENLLFIDCDSMPYKNSYIKDFIKYSDYQIVCGGTVYTPEQNIKGRELRYKYGIKREEVGAAIRNKEPNKSFTTNNFMIKSEIIRKICFNESITKYGHEDTLLGYELEKGAYVIKHIDNPVIHLGVESNKVFMDKTKQSINNLIEIQNNINIDNDFLNSIKLIRVFKLLKFTGLAFVLGLCGSGIINRIELSICNSNNPSLVKFDIFKLLYYIKIRKSKKSKS